MLVTSSRNEFAVTATTDSTNWLGDAVEAAHDLLARHDHFRGRAHTFEIDERDGVLTVRGQVPTFYLKQLLQHAFEGVAGIWCIENQVDVVSSDGLSSV